MKIDDLDKKELVRIIKNLIVNNWKVLEYGPEEEEAGVRNISLTYELPEVSTGRDSYRPGEDIILNVRCFTHFDEVAEKFIERILKLDFPEEGAEDEDSKTNI